MSVEEINEAIDSGRFDKASVLIQEYSLVNKLESLIFKSRLSREQGKVDLAIQYAEEVISASPFETELLLRASGARAYALWFKGELTESLKQIEVAKALLNTLPPPRRDAIKDKESLLYHLEGTVFLFSGKIMQAWDLFQKALAIRRRLGLQKETAISLNNCGLVYYRLGNYDNAMQYFEESYEICKNNNFSTIISLSLLNMGLIYRSRGHLDHALNSFRLALNAARSVGDTQRTALILGNIFYIHCLTNTSEKGEKEFNELQELHEANMNNKNIDLYYRFNLAMCHKNGTSSEFIEAQDILRKIINSEIIHHEFVTMSVKHLVELLLREYSVFPNPEILEEINTLLSEKLYLVAKANEMLPTLTEALILQSKLQYLMGNNIESQELLDQALENAKEHNLSYLIDEVKVEIVEREQIFHSIDKLISNQAKDQRAQAVEYLNYLKKLQLR